MCSNVTGVKTKMASSTLASGASKSVPRVVPWLDAEEWRSARKALYSNKIEEIRLGILQAKIWMERGKVPTAVESTVNFLETILIDRECIDEFLKTRDAKGTDDFGIEVVEKDCEYAEKDFHSLLSDDRLLRLAYNTAIIRFVNELVDRAQKSLFATSITKLADQIGLPRVFVDIRHDGTHDKLNSLELLRWAAWEALKWLENEYWSFEDDSSSVTWTSEFASNIHNLLDQYCDQLEKISESQSTMALEKSSYARIISQIDFLQTLPRIMKSFLIALCDYKRSSRNVIESIIRVLARNTGDLFCEAVVEIVLTRKEATEWLPWIVDELKKSSNEALIGSFASKLLESFAKQSSRSLFQEKLLKIWELLGPLICDEKIRKIYVAFEAVYHKNVKANFVSKVAESRNLVNKRKYFEDETIEGWSVVNENWRPCPLGSIPI